MKPLHCTILASLGGAFAALGLLAPSARPLQTAGAAIFLFGLSYGVGLLAFPDEGPTVRTLLGSLGATALLASFGAGVYHLYALDAAAVAGLLILLPWAVFAFSPLAPRKGPRVALTAGKGAGDGLVVARSMPTDAVGTLLVLLAAGFDLAALSGLLAASTSEAIRSPWDVVPGTHFLWIFLASSAILLLAWRGRNPHLTLGATVLHLFVLLAPAVAVYEIGFGFDPFVHIATEKLIAAEGAVTPKPFYYIGQYATVVVLSKTLGLDVATLDRLLLPILSAAMLPIGAVYLLRRGFRVERPLAALGALAVFLVPLASFASTTPQGLANLFSTLCFLFGAAWLHGHRPPLGFIALLAGAALATHPLSGIPAFLFVLFLVFFKLREWRHPAAKAAKGAVFVVLFAAASAAVPAVFELNARLAGGTAGVVEAAMRPASELVRGLPVVAPSSETRYAPALDLAELFSRNRAWLVLFAAAGGAAVLLRKKGYRRTVWAVTALAAALLANAAVMNAGLSLANVIEYERDDYGDRLFELALFLLLPLMLAASAWWWRSLRGAAPSVRVFGVLLFAALMTASGYLAFPRNDAFVEGRGYSVSAHDIEAVRWVNRHGRMPYVVLANQSVSAAALSEYGFRRYYGDQFYYPIPTGAPLYGHYLSMVEDGPSRATMEAAMRSVGAARAYFIVNDYWTDFDDIVAVAKTQADRWAAVGGGKAFVFEYGSR